MVAGPTTGEDEPPAIDADGKDQQTIENHRDRGYHQFASPR